jgi:hypothetical protein
MSLRPGGALIAIAVLLVTQAVVLAACDDDNEFPRETGLWFAFPDAVLGREGPIRVVHVDSGDDKTVGAAGIYRNVAWSPEGNLLAAIRAGEEPAVLLFNLVDDEAPTLSVDLDFDEAQLAWSPDGARLIALSDQGMVILSREFEAVARIGTPEDPPGPAGYTPGMWSADSVHFAAYFHGYIVVVDRFGQMVAYDPALFVRYPEDTARVTVTGWEAPETLAVFEEAEHRSPTRYVLELQGDQVEVLSSSDFEPGTAPFQGLLAQASEAAGGTEVILGRSAAPPQLRWVVAMPGPGDAPIRVLVRRGELFLSAASGLFAQADPDMLARDLSILLLTADETEP